MHVRRISSFVLNILCLFDVYNCKKLYRNYSESFNHLAVTSGYVYVGGTHSLIQLNSTLHEVKVKRLDGRNLLLTPYDKQDGETVLISCILYENVNMNYKVHCRGLSTSEMAPQFSNNGITIKKSFSLKYVTTVIGTINSLTIASSGCLQNDGSFRECFAISNYEDTLNPFHSHTVRYLDDGIGNLDLKNDIVIYFKSVVVHGHFTYFLLLQSHTKSKLGKMCTKTQSSDSPFENINTYEDIPIYCVHNGVNYTIAQDMVFWNDYLLVTFHDGVRNVVCKFTDISDSFRKSRQDKLKCPWKDPNRNHYFQKPDLPLCYNKTNRKCETTHRIDIDCDEVNGDYCEPKYFGPVEGEIPMSGVAVYHTQNARIITKLTDVLQTDKFAVLNVGTSKGYIGTIFINETAAFSVGEFRIVQWNVPVIDIKIDGENVYAMTQNEVVNVAITDDCTGTSCEECIKSENLRCGWDIINKRCNKKYNESFWVPSAGKSCLTVIADHIVVKEDIIVDNKDYIDIKFKLEPAIHSTNLSYKVSGSAPGQIKTDDGGYKIDDYEVSSLDPINLEITDMDGILIGSTTVSLYKCGDAGNCTSCVKGSDCYWCPLKFQCLRNRTGCNGEFIEKRMEGSCPRVDGTKKVLLAKDKTEDIKVSALNLDVFAPSTSSGGLQVQLQYNHQDLENGAELVVYDCNDFGRPDGNCGNCMFQYSLGYQCRWCGSCEHIRDITGGCGGSQNCERTVSNISPGTGPEYGGTKITISGRNIGNPNDNIAVELYGIVCTDVIVIKPSTELQCTTGNFSAATREDLVISVNDERSNPVSAKNFFTYEEQWSITLDSFSPNTSIKAGGRMITIRGNNIGFDNGNTFDVSFCTDSNKCIKCRDVKTISKDNLMCKIDKSDTTMELTKLKVIIDSKTELINRSGFKFVGNPSITKPSPADATVFKSGGANIKIRGTGFRHVGTARIDNVDKPCIIKDTEVICETPPYVKSDFERRKRSLGQNINIHFDNYQVQSTIYYAEDPTFDLLTDKTPNILEYEEEKAIVITGNRLLEGASKSDYYIHVGLDGSCFVEDMTNENITCVPPKHAPRTNHSDTNTVFVMVVVGRIRFTVGHLKYTSPTSPLPLHIIVICVLAALLVLAVAFIVVLTVIMKQKKKKSEENYQMQLFKREDIIQASRVVEEDHYYTGFSGETEEKIPVGEDSVNNIQVSGSPPYLDSTNDIETDHVYDEIFEHDERN